MKRPLLLSAFAATLGSATALPAAAQNTQIYGRLVTSVNHTKLGDGSSRFNLEENGSRLGFRGSEDLGGGLSARYGLELGFDATTGVAMEPNFRHSYVGLQGGFGMLAMGRLDSGTPVGAPIFSTALTVINLAPNDAGATQIGPNYLNLRNRVSNAIGYVSPDMAGFVVRGRYYLRGTPANVLAENGAKSFDVGVAYRNGPWRTGLGYARDSRPGGLLPNEIAHKWTGGLRYEAGWIAPYVLVGRDSYANTASSRRDVDYWLLGARFSHKAHALVVNIMQREVQTSRAAKRPKQQLAYTYAFSKRTEFQAFYDHDEVDSLKPELDKRVIGIGLRHAF